MTENVYFELKVPSIQNFMKREFSWKKKYYSCRFLSVHSIIPKIIIFFTEIQNKNWLISTFW